MAERILVVDDEVKVRTLLAKYLRHSGYEPVEVGDGRAAVERCRGGGFDMVILDVMLPVLDGCETCRTIRTFSDVPILMLSARGEEYDRVRGFKLGADDYVVKPFSPKELMLRVGAILKRRGTEASIRTLGVDGLVVDPGGHRVTVNGETVSLSPKEFELLALLCANPGVAMARARLQEEVWGAELAEDTRTLDTHIKQLRRALGPYAEHIVTVRGVGYRFD